MIELFHNVRGTLYHLFTQYNDILLYIQSSLLIIFGLIILVYWNYNRRKYQQLGHAIPANVVKNYLDSIIHNSNSLKSQLFRGGGLELGDGVPSVIPISKVAEGSSEELAQKMALIASLESQLTDKGKTITELEAKLALGSSSTDVSGVAEEVHQKALNEIEELKKALEAAKASGGGGGGDPQLQAQLNDVTKERDDLKERLQEYEIIEDDLANLKRLQQENEQLKKSLAEAGGKASEAPADPPKEEPKPEAAPEVKEEPKEEPKEEIKEEPKAEAKEEVAAAAPESEEPKAEASADGDAPDIEGEGKSAEDLLSEFEKMLG